jgi:hypothetical protein
LISGYAFIDFVDPSGAVDAMIYNNNPFRNCSVELLQVTQSLFATVEDMVFPNSQFFHAKDKVLIACNTSAAQWFEVQSNRNIINPLNQRIGQSSFLTDLNNSTPLDINETIPVWVQFLLGLWYVIAPMGTKSIFHLCLTEFNLSSLQLSYFGTCPDPPGSHLY